MLFNSVHFFVFFVLVTSLYFSSPHRSRWFVLLAASVFFYMCFIPAYILILFFTIGVDYIAGLVIEPAQGPRRRLYLTLSIIANVGVLAVFKYFNFLNDNLGALAGFLSLNYPIEDLGIILPIGLSFHTFQSMSYTIEVYRGAQKAERHLGIFSLYVLFYPQLVAGPIERPQNLLPQMRRVHSFDAERVGNGLKLMAWGLFKKVAIADRLAMFVVPVYSDVHSFEGVSFVVATVFFAIQIYCDFSGYSDIAIGAAQTMGFRLMDNFDRPYSSRSVAEFWTRWHISLSTWFRDYVYVPLGGNRVSRRKWVRNILITFLISGLWHGANWTFVVWGGLNGLFILVGRRTQQQREALARITGLAFFPRLHGVFKVAVTFGLTCLAWVFFRAPSVSDAAYVITHLFTGWGKLFANLGDLDYLRAAVSMGQPFRELAASIVMILLLETVHAIQRHRGIRAMLSERPGWVRWTVYAAVSLAILNFGVATELPFIYFQF